MTNWKEYKLGDLVAVNERSIGRNFDIKNIEYIDTSSVTENKFDTPTYTQISEAPSRAKRLIADGDTIISTVRPIQKHYGFIKKAKGSQVVSTGFAVVTPKKIEPRFLYYFLTQAEITEYLNTIAEGGTTTFPAFKADELKELSIKLPDLPTQIAISEILSSLDDKIEHNTKINQELENLAQTLFKQWFIDFEFPNENGEPYKSSGGEMVDSELGEIPKGWELKKLGELVKKSNTGADAIKRAPIINEDTGVRCVRVGDMTNKRPFDEWGFCKITPEDYKRYKLEINDIVITRTATLGINRIIRNEIKGVYNNGLIRLKMDENKLIPLLAYCFFQSDAYKIWIERISGDSSTRPNMQINYLLDFPMYQCPIPIQSKFIDQATVIFENLENNILENRELKQLRDTLLPMLISGELEVSEVLT
jgi:type I restriction enzyme S subunit